jgi:tRNA(fMet)-specific endonuclease VapC
MTYLLDTNTCIQYLNGRSDSIRRRIESTRRRKVVLCSVVKAELYFGALKSAVPERNLAQVRRFVDGFASLPFDDLAAQVYGEIRARLERAGTPIGPNDPLIAAIAVAQGATLVTHNSGEFGRVARLQQEDWQ